MESPPTHPSVRKQFLTKIYQRNSTADKSPPQELQKRELNQNSSFTSSNCDSSQDLSSVSSSPSKMLKRSSTPGSTSSLHKARASNMSVFSDFLSDLLRMNGSISSEILAKTNTVTKALNDNFARNPEFSLQFYISMTGILNLLNEPQGINPEELMSKVEEAIGFTNEGITEMEQLTILKKHIAKINLKVITTLKRLLMLKEDIQLLSHCFLVFFSNADKEIEVSPNKKIPATSVLSTMQKYTLMPGKMIQTCRRVVDFIHKKQIPSAHVKLAQDIFFKINEQIIMEIDRSGGMLILYDYLKACFAYYWAYSQSVLKPSSMYSEKRRSIDNESKNSKDNSMNSSRNATPIRNGIREAHSYMQSSIVSISESTKSFNVKDSFEAAVEDKFKEFLKNRSLNPEISILMRIQLMDDFEREIRDDLRARFLERVTDEMLFKEDLRKAKE